MKKRKQGLLLTLHLIVLVGLLPATCIAAEELPRGTPVDKVVCAADAEQSYALYLPAAYSSERRWPVIYIFEPGARGPLAIGVFRAAAEKYGYVLACSNNSRNGPWEPTKRALRAVWTDTRQRLSIDDNRVYSAGHSGGAQVALTFGLILGKPWAGVISCCGGLPNQMPMEALPKGLAVFVSTGLYDFNYWPSRNIGTALDAVGITNRLQVFHDGHTWLPGDAVMDAVSWLELQAMKKELRPRDDGWVAAQFAARFGQVQEIERQGKTVEAYEACLALAADFRGLVDVAPVESTIARLNQPALIEKYRQGQKEAEKEEIARFTRGNGALRALLNAASARERRRLTNELGIPGLRRETEQGDDSFTALTARRLLGYFFGQAAMAANQAYERGDMKTARDIFGVTVLIQPENRNAWLNLACVHSRLGEKKDALRALETAVQKGVKDWESIEKDPDFEAIRKEGAYIRLIEALKKDPPAKQP